MSSSSFFKNSGTSVTIQNTIDTLITDAEAAKTAAETAATNASTSAGLSSTYANNSNDSANSSASSLSSAQTAQSAAETAETNAETAQAAAETAETNAAASASTASTQASNASTSATNAASSASTASTKASEASTSATNAATSETNAATSATNASSSATTASGHASTASTQASNASTSATNAATSETNAATSATTASTQASNASTSATNAATSASTASTQATNASNSATAAATSATNASNSATAAASSATTAQSLSDSFNNIYLGALSSAPSQDPDGSALDEGDLYYDTTQGELKVYKSSGWAAAGSTVNGTSARFHYDITTTTGTLSGSDANGNTLAYDAGYVDVYVNGVRMSDADVTTTSGNSIVFTEDLVSGDDVDIVAYGTFVITQLNADNLDSGTVPDARITGAYTGITNLTMSGNLTVDTNTLYVDSANNRVGVGTVSPSDILHIKDSSSTNVIIDAPTDNASLTLQCGSSDAGAEGAFINFIQNTTSKWQMGMNTNNTFRWYNYNTSSEAMQIDSSGNLLVGTTSTDDSTDGFKLKNNGQKLTVTRDGAESLVLNRRTSDGDILKFRKDNSTVGSIGVVNTDRLYIGTPDGSQCAIRFDGDTQDILPSNASGAALDDAISLGDGGTRFKDLYLAGNAGVGANPSSFNGGANNLVVGTGSGSEGISIFADSSSNSSIFFADGDSTTTGQLNYQHASNAFTFHTNGGTERMRIDSSGNVGIGTSSPANTLAISKSTTSTDGSVYPSIKIENTSSGSGNSYANFVLNGGNGTTQFSMLADGRSGNSAAYIRTDTATPLLFLTNGSERARIDSSGNLLVGKTAIDSGVAGFEVDSDGKIAATRSASQVAIFNRLTSDGDIATFRKDGSTVGSISAWSSGLLVGTGDVGLAFVDGTPERIQPRKADDQTSADGLIDLGHSSNRFKDLFLSGGVYLGGTGSSNHLNDYETGDIDISTMNFENSGSATTHTFYQTLRYVKIGSQVTITGNIFLDSVTSQNGALKIPLPFANGTGQKFRTVGIIGNYQSNTTTVVKIDSAQSFGVLVNPGLWSAVTVVANQTYVVNVTYNT